MQISQSALGLFIDCPYQYKLSYIDECQPIYYNAESFIVGKCVHEAIETFYKRTFTINMRDPEEILYYTYQNLKRVWDLSLSSEDFLKAHQCLKNHAEWLSSYNISTEPIVEPHLVEQTNNGYQWHGYIDFIDLPNKKVIDWKTNTSATLSKKYRIQAQVYKILFESAYNIKLDHFHFFFLYPNTWRTVSFNNKTQLSVAEEMAEERSRFIKSIQKNSFTKDPRTDNMCKWCPYRFYCKILLY